MLTSPSGNWTISYYDKRLEADLLDLPDSIFASYQRLYELIEEYGANLRLPHSRAMGEGLFELRPRGREGIGRVFYCTMIGKRIVMLHSFVKKTQETPDRELRIARARMKEVKAHD
jgi:phage-related protein